MLTSWMSSEKYSLSCLSGRYYTYLEALCSCHSCRGQTRRGKGEFPSPAGAAFSAPPHPHTELVISTSSLTWKPSLRKLCGEVGECSFLPGPKQLAFRDLKMVAHWERLAPGKRQRPHKGHGCNSWLPSGASQTNCFPFLGRRWAHRLISSVPSSSQQ